MALRCRHFRSFLAVLAAGSFLSAPLYAAGGAEVASPTKSWEVQSGVLQSAGGGVPYCSISNAYSNDVAFEFYGTSGRLAALKLELADADFVPETAGSVRLSVPGLFDESVNAAFLGPQSMIVNVKNASGLLPALQSVPVLYLSHANKNYAFSMSGIHNIESRLYFCKDTVVAQSANRALPAYQPEQNQASRDPVVLHSAQAQKAKAILQGQTTNEIEVVEQQEPAEILEAPQNINPYPVNRDVQARPSASEIAQRQSFITDDASYSPNYKAQQDRGAFMPETASRAAPSAAPAPKDWQALKGSDIREVFALWSEEEGVELVWNTLDQFAVKETIKSDASYEEAIERVLQQYDTVSPGLPRPVGSLHIDENSGKRTLLIQSERI